RGANREDAEDGAAHRRGAHGCGDPRRARRDRGARRRMLMRLLVFWIGLWPERWALAFGEALGALVHALGIRRRVVLENLAQAFPEKSDAEREAICAAHYAHLGRSAIEFFRSV